MSAPIRTGFRSDICPMCLASVQAHAAALVELGSER